ncbi:GNAT family N-acetyltransferase [uncultured Duncaniella sp.]|uniref:GNAT family N-acetyltransferase n=1 Tax=uncultured Duncaniella sp. TaxID=2768039 RepID=UPI0025F3998E|nr:GNAT family N-acetyltransferase [uncultured Duncaniella sp.]
MSKRDEIKKIWTECFKDPRGYVDMFFDQVYRDDEAMLLTDQSGAAVSSLLLQHFTMSFHGSEPSVSYIAGAATRRSKRGQGYMSRLMVDALRESAVRGDMLCSLIPADEALFFFYRRYGFSTVFYTKEQRFTSFHSFSVKGEYHHVDNEMSDEVWCAFDRFQRRRKCYVLHSRRDFYNILSDLKADGGDFVVMAKDDEDSGSEIVSMAWARKEGDLLLVTDVMGEDSDARLAALRQLRCLNGNTPVLLYGHPDDSMGGRLMPRGMGRFVNVGKALSIVAASDPKFTSRIRVTDDILPDYNSHTFILHDGRCEIDDDYEGYLDFDVTIDVFADIVFSSSAIGSIVRFPSVRPMISLMLD